ncbi:MAG: hypothetical protein ABL974_04630 [Prosthecobacter sp.]
MHSPETLAYFCAQPGRSFWEWNSNREDDIRAFDGTSKNVPEIVWADDHRLIVFRVELNGILEEFAHPGLPPLGSMLLVLDALSDQWTADNLNTRLLKIVSICSGESMSGTMLKLAMDVCHRLSFITKLPSKFTASGPARHRLFLTLFEDHPDLLDPGISRTILAQFVQTPDVSIFSDRPPGLNGIARLLKDLTALEKAFQRCPPESLEERLRTGLDELPMRQLELPLPDPAETPVPEIPADLLRALEHEGGELAQVAGLVRRMSAILHVPKAVTHRDELPLGGVSDITNRGDPSRLLMTELAWDDLTFAVRIAQGEALYLRRESPPAEPPPRRLLLIDNGIFLWGKPRLFALGAALALLKQKLGPEAPIGTVFTLTEGRFIPITLETVADVRAQLTRLEPQPHPGTALSLLAEADDNPFKPEEEVFLFTHPAAAEALTTLPIWQQLAHRVPLHTLLVDREGSLELSRHSSVGVRVLSKARVEAEDLFESRQPAQKKTAHPSPAALTDEAGRLPRFYGLQAWPLDHPAPPRYGKVFEVLKRGFIGCSTEGCVCWWDRRAELGKVLLFRMPAEELILVAADKSDPDWHFLVFRDRGASHVELALVSIKTSVCDGVCRIEVGQSDILFPCLNSGFLVMHLDDHSDAWSIQNSDAVKVATIQRTSKTKGWPVYDGAQFHEQGMSEMPCSLRELAKVIPVQHSQRQIIRRLCRVGIGTSGRLMIETEGGHVYRLNVNANTGLAWIGCHVSGIELCNFQPVDLERWRYARLMVALLSDGRRIIYDPLGYLHICDASEDGEQLSLILVRGHTAAWGPKGKHYGEPNLLDIHQGLPAKISEIVPLTQRLFRPVEAVSPSRKKGPMP